MYRESAGLRVIYHTSEVGYHTSEVGYHTSGTSNQRISSTYPPYISAFSFYRVTVYPTACLIHPSTLQVV